MALVLANRVQEAATANTTVSFTLTGPIAGFQSFAVIGDTNTTYYSATDASGNWEVGLGTYSTTGPTLTRTTIYASSNSGNAVTFSGTVNVFVTYPSGKSVNLDTAGNVSSLGTVSSGTWQGSTIGVAYGGTGVTASSGANSVMLRDANQNVAVNRLNQSNTSTTAAGGTTALTAASSYIHTLVGTGGQTYTMPDATTLTTGVAFVFNNMATGTLTIQNYAAGAVGTIPAGGAGAVFLTDNSTTGGIWDIHAYLPEGVTFGTNAFNLGTSVISGGTWQGGTIQPGYGGTGLTTFTGANNALYSTGATTLTAGTLPSAAGGTGLTTFTGANNALYSTSASALTAGTLPSAAGGTGLTTFTGANNALYSTDASTLAAGTLPVAAGGTGATTLTGYVKGNGTGAFTASASIPNSDTTATSANTPNAIVARDGSGNFSAGTITADLTGTASSATSATTSTNLAGGVSGAVPYQSGVGTTGFSAAGTAGQVLTSAGTSAPTWTTATDSSVASAIVQRDASGNFSAGTITATLNGNATNVTGTVGIANGGTGQTTANAALNALLPSQTSQAGKYLTTNGVDTSWGTITAGASLANDTSTATNLYPLFAAATTGTPTTIYTSNAQYLFKPSTGELSVKAPRGSNGVFVNSQTVTDHYVITSSDNGGSFGPITVTTGSITVSSGAVWTVV